MLENYDIVCFGPSDWWGMNPSCATHIISRLAVKNRVVYINPFSSDLLGITAHGGFMTRLLRKLKSMAKPLRKITANLYVVSLFFLPIQGMAIIDNVNNILLKLQLRLTLWHLEMSRPVLWIENIRCADIIPGFRWRLIVYHVSDLFAECPYTYNKNKLRRRENLVSEYSDMLVCVSRSLYEYKYNGQKNIYYLPHGVDFDIFRYAAQRRRFCESLYQFSHPLAGYFGTLTAENDTELLEYCAINLPAVTFVFAGRITGGDYSGLMGLKNTVFLSRVTYEKIPQLCAVLDLGLLPWRLTDWIAKCNPLKLLEYMAGGKPVVSVAIDEVVCNYADIVSIAHTKEEFCRAIKWELENDTHERRIKRMAVARARSWENHNRHLCDIIEASLEKKHAAVNHCPLGNAVSIGRQVKSGH